MGKVVSVVIGAAQIVTGLATGNPMLIFSGLAMIGKSLLLAPKPEKFRGTESFGDKQQKRIQTIRSSISPRQIIYGETVVSGPLVAAFSSGSDNKYLHLFICLAGHEVEEISTVWLNDKVSTDTKYGTLVRVNKHLGAADQAADTQAASEIPAWTTNHRLRGIAYLYIRLEWDQNVWISGIPNVKAKVKGKKVFDPRTSTTVWSDNPILCERDYMVNEFGAAVASVDDAVVIAEANVCDELVALNGGGTQKRYTCNGVVTKDMKPIDIMEELKSSCAGVNVRQQGVYKLYAGVYSTPTITLDEDDLRGDIEIQTKDSRKDLVNAIKGEFVDPANNYLPTNFPPRTNAAFEAEDGGLRIFKTIELPFTDNNIRSQRISKIHLMRARQGVKVFFPAKMTAYEITAWDMVNLNISKLGWVNKSFRVLSWNLAPEGGIDLNLQEDVAEDWAWVSTEEQSISAPPDMPVPDPLTVAAPANLTLASGTAELLQKADGTVITRIKVSWDIATDEMVLNGGHYEIQLKKSTDSVYYFGVIVSGTQTFGHLLNIIDGINYDVRVKAVNTQGVSSSWSISLQHNVTGKTAAPSDVLDFSVVQIGDRLLATWSEIADSDRSEYEIRRGTVWEATSPVAKTKKSFLEISDWFAGSYTYLIKAIDTTGNVSVNAASYTVALEVANERASVLTFNELVGLGGVFDGLVKRTLSGGGNGLALEPSQDWDVAGDIWDTDTDPTNWDGDTILLGKYVSEVVNIGVISYARAMADIRFSDADGASILLEESHSDDNISYSSWRIMGPGDQKFRYIKIRLTMMAASQVDDPVIDYFEIVVDALVREIRGTKITVPTGAGLAIVYPVSFIQTPNVQITPQDESKVVYISTSNKTGFTLKHNEAGAVVVDYTAKGV